MSKRILIIDDEWAIQRVLQVRLQAAGFTVELASDGPAGIKSALKIAPDVVLLDVRMPEMDGFEVMRRFQADTRLRGIPIIFISANVLDTVKQSALAAGAVGFLAKPYESHVLIQLIESVLASTIRAATSVPTSAPAQKVAQAVPHA